VSVGPSICLYSAWNNLSPLGRISKFEYFSKIWLETQLSWKYDKNKGTLHENPYMFWSVVSHFFLKWQTFRTEFVEAIQTHKTFFGKSCRIRDYVKKCGRVIQVTDKNMIRCVRIDYWINKITDTHSEYVSVSTATMITQTLLGILFYMHFLSCERNCIKISILIWRIDVENTVIAHTYGGMFQK
jgi:hypothetical protein